MTPQYRPRRQDTLVVAACATACVGLVFAAAASRRSADPDALQTSRVQRMYTRNPPVSTRYGLGSIMRGARQVSMQSSIVDENREAYKQVIMEYVKDGFGSGSVNAWKADINEMLFRLEPLNPTEEPAYSSLLKGEWEFKFVGSMAQGILPSPTREIALLLSAGGYTPGRFGLDIAARLPKDVVDVKSLKLKIQDQAPTATISTIIKLPGNRDVEVSLDTNLEPESDFTMSETYQSLTAMGQSLDLPANLRSKRRFYIRYLDEEIMVVRDDTGVADVLVRASGISDAAATESVEAVASDEGVMMSFDEPSEAS